MALSPRGAGSSVGRLLEHVPQPDDDATVAAVRAPLVEEVRVRDGRGRDAEVARVGEVKEVGPELEAVALADPRVLQDAEVDVVDAVRAQDVATGIADALARPEGAEEDAPARRDDLLDAHPRQVERRVEVRADRVADQPRDARQRARRV